MAVYLITENLLKKRSYINDSTLDIYIRPAIETAQEIFLQQVIGSKLLRKLKYLVSTANSTRTGVLIDHPDYKIYKELLSDYITPFLVQTVQSEMVVPMTLKINNRGVTQATDQYTTGETLKEITFLKENFKQKADFFADRITSFCKTNKSAIKEFESCDNCGDIHAKNPSYSSNLVLD